MIGIGVFLTPITMALDVPTTGAFLAIWVAAGLISMCGAVAYAELSCMMPLSGGDYLFQRRAFGDSVAFAYGWGLFIAAFAGSIAALTVPLCSFQLGEITGLPMTDTAFSLPGPIGDVKWAEISAIGVVCLMTWLNVAGVRLSTMIQNLTTLVPIVLFTGMAIFVLIDFDPSANIIPTATSAPMTESLTLSGLVSAFLAAYFAYAGWNAIVYVAGEVEAPEKNIPRSIIGGLTSVILLYLLFAGTFVAVLGLDGLSSLYDPSNKMIKMDVGSAVALEVAGTGAKLVIVSLIAAALLSTINATILGGGRVGYALAKDGAFWSKAGTLHPKTGTPAHALWAQAFFASLMILLVPWYVMFELVGLIMVVGTALTVIALYILRRKEPAHPRPYRAKGYPVVPALFVLTSVLVLGSEIYDIYRGEENAWYPMIGLGIVVIAFVVHRLKPSAED
jgi:APA family basic amino acid/polyamine antiporter